MALLAQHISPEDLQGNYVFLDNDFLGIIFEDDELLRTSMQLLSGSYITIDGFTRLEFLRDVWLPEIRDKKELFLANTDIFSPVAEHQIIFEAMRENALELSRLYAHKKRAGVSMVDLLLAGRAMMIEHSIIITGNKKDFPSFIFDVVGVTNFEQNDGTMRSISAVKFNRTKYAECVEAYRKVLGRS